MNSISHKGFVESVTGNTIIVKIVQSSACSGCKIASHCASSESKEKLVEVIATEAEAAGYTPGDEVTVFASESVGAKAVAYGFVVPFFVLIVALFAALLAGMSEPASALIGLASLIPYYTILYLCRSYFDKIVKFSIRRN